MTGIFDEMKCQNIVDIVKQLSQLNTKEHQKGHKELLTCSSTINYLIFTMNAYVHAHARACVHVCVRACMRGWVRACMRVYLCFHIYACIPCVSK